MAVSLAVMVSTLKTTEQVVTYQCALPAIVLRLFLDSADPGDWDQWLPSGLFYGVTTNPTLLRRAGRTCRLEDLRQLSCLALAHGIAELQVQAWGIDDSALRRCSESLAALAPGRIVVKLPLTREGASAARDLTTAGVPVTFTACYEPHQVLIAAALGARYIAPYLGRIADQGRDALAEVGAMQRTLDGLGSTARLLVASLRQPQQLSLLAAAGVDTFTISAALAGGLFDCAATQAASDQFERDAQL